MQGLIELIENPHPTWITHKKNRWGRRKSVSVCTWQGVRCQELNQLYSIWWDHSARTSFLRGNLSLVFLPDLVSFFVHGHVELRGTLPLDRMAVQSVKDIQMQGNRFSDHPEFRYLPQRLEELNLGKNSFWGELDLQALPPGLRKLSLYDNNFSGTADFRNLPLSMLEINLQTNNLLSALFQEEPKPINGYSTVTVNIFLGGNHIDHVEGLSKLQLVLWPKVKISMNRRSS